MVDIKALGKKILVRQLPNRDITEGGIILPGKSKGDITDYENWLAEVIDIGELAREQVQLHIGDIIMMDPSYAPIMFDDPNFIKVTSSSIQDKTTPFTGTAEPLMMAFVTYEQILSKVTIK